MSVSSDSNIYIECSDDENYGMKLMGTQWIPQPDDIVRLYEFIDEKKNVELEWQCPGRRSATPTDTTVTNYSVNETTENSPLDKSDFDFQEEMSHLKLSVRPVGVTKPKGSAKKKTTTFNAILSNMARHRKLDMITTEKPKNAN